MKSNSLFKIIIGTAALTLLSSCATGPTYTQPPTGQVAIVKAPATSLLSPSLAVGNYYQTYVGAVDGQKLKWMSYGDVKLTPGTHTLTVGCSKTVMNLNVTGENTVTLNAKAGHIYTLQAIAANGQCVTVIKDIT